MPNPALDTEELRQLVADALELPVEEITDDASFVEDLEVDSLISLEIVIRLEERYGMKVSDADMQNMASFRDVHALVEAWLATESAA